MFTAQALGLLLYFALPLSTNAARHVLLLLVKPVAQHNFVPAPLGLTFLASNLSAGTSPERRPGSADWDARESFSATAATRHTIEGIAEA